MLESEPGGEADARGGERLGRQEAVAVGNGGEAGSDGAGPVRRGHRERTEHAQRDLQQGAAAQDRKGEIERPQLVSVEIGISPSRRVGEQQGGPGTGDTRARDK